MIILSIDTSCDETSVAVTEGNNILSNVLWSQASIHSKFGGVYPSLAKRAHEENIDWVISKALKKAFANKQSTDYNLRKNIDAIAVTVGPGLAIALEVGINKAKELSVKFSKPFIPVNHVEGHLLSPLARPGFSKFEILNSRQLPTIKPRIPNKSLVTDHQLPNLPALGFVASGKHTDLIYIKAVGNYNIIAHTIDDALGEALDKAARMLGLGYPGGPILENLARNGNPKAYFLPIPLLGQTGRMEFSYSGLKTAMYRLVEKEKPLNKEKIENLSASFQNIAFIHVENLINEVFINHSDVKTLFFGGGVSANIELRKRLRKICKTYGIRLFIPYSKILCTDNAGMIGVAAGFKFEKGEFLKPKEVTKVDREPRAKIDVPFLL